MKELIEIVSELKAPKKQYNKFSNFYYRSCEDILEAVKPLLKRYNCFLIFTDEIECINGWNYLKAKATLYNSEKEYIESIAYAREQETRKGMDQAQITGATSSYARKYALNGLFCIDDTKDQDNFNNSEKTFKNPEIKKKSQLNELDEKRIELFEEISKIATNELDQKKIYQAHSNELFKKNIISKDLTLDQINKLIKNIKTQMKGN